MIEVQRWINIESQPYAYWEVILEKKNMKIINKAPKKQSYSIFTYLNIVMLKVLVSFVKQTWKINSL